MLKEFREFIARGNVLDLAVGVIIGGAFGAISKSLVDDVLMPPLGLVTGGVDFSDKFALLRAGAKAPPPYASLAEAKAAREAAKEAAKEASKQAAAEKAKAALEGAGATVTVK